MNHPKRWQPRRDTVPWNSMESRRVFNLQLVALSASKSNDTQIFAESTWAYSHQSKLKHLRVQCEDPPNISIPHYSGVIMSTMASQITSLEIVYSTVYSGADQRTHQSSASLAFVRGIHRWPVKSPHKGPVARKSFPFDDVIIQAI